MNMNFPSRWLKFWVSIPTTELRDVFRNWIRGLEQVIDTHGEYIS
jgi:hypothetical protein